MLAYSVHRGAAPCATSSSCPSAASSSAAQATAQPDQKVEAAKSADGEARERAVIAQDKGLQTVYFDFDRSFIRDEDRAVMKANAEWLKAHPQSNINIEGNCDERGTKEYNQTLGQRRAANAKKYLTDMGISGRRISLISYGKEKPGCTESTESCLQKNRRDEFVVVPDYGSGKVKLREIASSKTK